MLDEGLDLSPATVLVEKVKGALRLAAANRQALEIGLSPGMTLADARARAPDLRVVVHRPEADATLLKRVLLDFGRFTPMAATDGLDGLAIVPVMIGGITRSIHRTPAKCTMTPISASKAPTTTIPPSADDCPFDAVAASTGAMIAKLEPR